MFNTGPLGEVRTFGKRKLWDGKHVRSLWRYSITNCHHLWVWRRKDRKKNEINLTRMSVYVIKTVVNCYCLFFLFASFHSLFLMLVWKTTVQCDKMIYLSFGEWRRCIDTDMVNKWRDSESQIYQINSFMHSNAKRNHQKLITNHLGV